MFRDRGSHRERPYAPARTSICGGNATIISRRQVRPGAQAAVCGRSHMLIRLIVSCVLCIAPHNSGSPCISDIFTAIQLMVMTHFSRAWRNYVGHSHSIQQVVTTQFIRPWRHLNSSFGHGKHCKAEHSSESPNCKYSGALQLTSHRCFMAITSAAIAAWQPQLVS